MAKYKRRITVVKPAFQLKIILIFLCIALSCMLIQMALMSSAFNAMESPSFVSTKNFHASVKGTLWENFLVALGLLIPFSVAVGIVITFRIAGPVHRFEEYFRAIRDGKATGPCRVREKDEFQELCKLINEAMVARNVIPATAAQSKDTPPPPAPPAQSPTLQQREDQRGRDGAPDREQVTA